MTNIVGSKLAINDLIKGMFSLIYKLVINI